MTNTTNSREPINFLTIDQFLDQMEPLRPYLRGHLQKVAQRSGVSYQALRNYLSGGSCSGYKLAKVLRSAKDVKEELIVLYKD